MVIVARGEALIELLGQELVEWRPAWRRAQMIEMWNVKFRFFTTDPLNIILNLSKSFRSLVESMLINWWPKFRNKSNGEGIFTFYSENAQEILKDIKYAKSPKKKSLSNDAGSNAKEASGGGSIILKNPLTYLFKRESSQTSKDKTENIAKQEKGRRKVLEKSVSMMEEFNRQEKTSRQQKKELLRELKSGQATAKSSSLTRTRTQPSHLDTSYYRCGHKTRRLFVSFTI